MFASLLTARSNENYDSAVANIYAAHVEKTKTRTEARPPLPHVTCVLVEFLDLAQLGSATKRLVAELHVLDMLVLNAGSMIPPTLLVV